MDSVLDLFLGVPIYDENKQVVRRNFGIKNAVAICLTFYALYYFLPKTAILSGMIPKGSKNKGSKGKIQKGGVWGKIGETFGTVMAACFIGGGGSFLLNLLFCGDHEPGGMCALGIFFMIILICFVLWNSVKFGKNIWSPPPSK